MEYSKFRYGRNDYVFPNNQCVAQVKVIGEY